ncbi:MAG TPA: PaaI family thioesterase [Symbiobacteriaceae bacterium]|jgi:uncharacterized protein (TIGR00369 family)
MITKENVGGDVPFNQYLGIEIVTIETGRVVIALDPRPEYLNSWQVMHGGITMTMLDVALGSALRTTDPELSSAISVELKTNFIAPGKGRILAEGRVLHKGSTISVCEGEARDEAGVLLAKAVGTYTLHRKKDSGER